jgi:hypothetical protein
MQVLGTVKECTWMHSCPIAAIAKIDVDASEVIRPDLGLEGLRLGTEAKLNQKD